MRKILLFLVVIVGSAPGVFSQYWQQHVNYTIDVSLNDKENSLDGFEKIEYTNHSPDTLHFIWFHLWPNAYKNDKTAFSDQLLENGKTDFYFSGKEQKGYINRLDFKVNNTTATLEDHPQYIDIAKLILPIPLAPGQTINITTPFHVKLPFNYSRGGHDGESYQVTQWYPKPAVYDKNGWHEMPYLDQGEFYGEFGNFDVAISVPDNYVVAATGELQNEAEKEWLTSRSNYDWKPVIQKQKIKGGGVKITRQNFPTTSGHSKTLEYKQNNIHDFAWFADKRFIVNYDTCMLTSGRVIDVYAYYTPKEKTIWKNSVQHSKDAIRHYSRLIGEYPFNVVSVVQGPGSFGGGMEYPTITVISPTRSEQELDRTSAHEIGHNWFYGILGTNERAHPWMDEGINSFYEDKYSLSKDPTFNQRIQQSLLQTFVAQKRDQPIGTPSAKFSETNYYLIAYYKTAEWMIWMEKMLGTETFNKSMQEYYRRWQFKHPQPDDLKKSMEDVSGKNLDSAFALLDIKGPVPGWGRKGVAFQGPMGAALGKNKDKQSVITALPIAGANSYDKIMLGLALTNLRLPPSSLQFLVIPMYATGSKSFTGIGFLYHTFYPEHIFQKIELGVNASKFTVDQFTDENGKKTYLPFQKIVPGIKLTLKEKNPRSTLDRFVQFKSFFIREDGLNFFRDTVIAGVDTSIFNNYRTVTNHSNINQLQFVIDNYRALYPYRAELKLEQGKDFGRIEFTGKYFFNYSKGGGLDVRFFAGKFLYMGEKTTAKEFSTDRYHLNLTGPNGYEDYTYSDYFIGRNKFNSLPSQQIMVRDGGFKVRTDLLAAKVGKTDDWLIAANFSTTVPNNINPFSLLPFKFPLKLFFDIGTYAEAWKPQAGTDRFLYDAGIHIPIIKETINIYIPLLYSNVYRDYIKSTIEKKNRFLKTISFSIDISNFSLRKFDRTLSF